MELNYTIPIIQEYHQMILVAPIIYMEIMWQWLAYLKQIILK